MTVRSAAIFAVGGVAFAVLMFATWRTQRPVDSVADDARQSSEDEVAAPPTLLGTDAPSTRSIEPFQVAPIVEVKPRDDTGTGNAPDVSAAVESASESTPYSPQRERAEKMVLLVERRRSGPSQELSADTRRSLIDLLERALSDYYAARLETYERWGDSEAAETRRRELADRSREWIAGYLAPYAAPETVEEALKIWPTLERPQR
jgi:hypothetical protein